MKGEKTTIMDSARALLAGERRSHWPGTGSAAHRPPGRLLGMRWVLRGGGVGGCRGRASAGSPWSPNGALR